MTIKAYSMATKYDPDTGYVTFSMLDNAGRALVACEMPGDDAMRILLVIASWMEENGDLEDDDLDDETEVVGHC